VLVFQVHVSAITLSMRQWIFHSKSIRFVRIENSITPLPAHSHLALSQRTIGIYQLIHNIANPIYVNKYTYFISLKDMSLKRNWNKNSSYSQYNLGYQEFCKFNEIEINEIWYDTIMDHKMWTNMAEGLKCLLGQQLKLYWQDH